MSNVQIQKVNGDESCLPIFSDIVERFDEVRQRAYRLFEDRGGTAGHELEDWLKAECQVLGSVESEIIKVEGVYQIRVALSGFEMKDIAVTASPEAIIVHAVSKEEKENDEGEQVTSAVARNEIYRRFDIPAGIDVENTRATFKKGVLCIHVPKAASTVGKAMAANAA